MNTITEYIVNLSNGAWVPISNWDTKRFKYSRLVQALNNAAASSNFAVTMNNDAEGNLLKYRAQCFNGSTFIDAARQRKSKGITCGIESLPLIGGIA